MNDAGKERPLCPGTCITCKRNWTVGNDLGLVSNDSSNPLGKNGSHRNCESY